MASLFELFVQVTGDSSHFKKSMQESSDSLNDFASMAADVGIKLAEAFSFYKIAKEVYEASEAFASASNTIQRATGATGESLDGLTDSMRTLYLGSAQSMGAIGGVLTELAVKTGETGEALEALTQKFLNYAKVTGQDANAAVAQGGQMFALWNIGVRDQGAALDMLTAGWQHAGGTMQAFQQSLLTTSVTLRSLGFSYEESIALTGNFIKAGVDVSDLMRGLTAAQKEWSNEGKNSGEALRDLVQRMTDAQSPAEALALAFDAKLGRSAKVMVTAVAAGAFQLDETKAKLEASRGKTDELASSTTTLSGELTKLWHEIQNVALGFAPFLEGLTALLRHTRELIDGFFQWEQRAETLAAALTKIAHVSLALNPFTQIGRLIEGAPPDPNQTTLKPFPPAPQTAQTADSPNTTTLQPGTFLAPPPAALTAHGGEGTPGPDAAALQRQAEDRDKARAIEIDAELAHQKSLLDIQRKAIEDTEKMHLISADQALEELEDLNREELQLTQKAIQAKAALERQGDKRPESHQAKFLADEQAAEDAAAKKSDELARHAAEAKEKILDEELKYLGEGLKKQLAEEKSFDDEVANHAATLNRKLAEDRDKAAEQKEKGDLAQQMRKGELIRQEAAFEESTGAITRDHRIALDEQIDAAEIALERASIARQLKLLEERSANETNYASRKQALTNQQTALDDKEAQNAQRHAQEKQRSLSQEISLLQRNIELEAQAGKGNSAETVQLTNLQLRMNALRVTTAGLGGVYRDVAHAADQAFHQIGNSITQALFSGEKFGKAMKDILKSIAQTIVSTVIQALLNMAEAWLLTLVTSKVMGKVQLQVDAVTAAAGAYSATAIIPFVGPELAPKAAADAYANVLGMSALLAYEEGGNVGADGPAFLHAQEMVLPADIAIPLRRMVGNAPLESGMGGIHFHGPVSGVTRETVDYLGTQLIRKVRAAGARI